MWTWVSQFLLCSLPPSIPEESPCRVHMDQMSFLSETSLTASTSTCWYFTFALCCHTNETRALIANPPNSAQLGDTPTIPQDISGPCSSVGVMRGTDRHTHRSVWPLFILRRLQLMRHVTNTEANQDNHPLASFFSSTATLLLEVALLPLC